MVTEVMGGGALVAGRRNQTPTDLSNKEGFLTHLGKKKGDGYRRINSVTQSVIKGLPHSHFHYFSFLIISFLVK